MKRVLITGMGVISPYGVGLSPLVENVWAGRSAVVNMKEQWQQKVSDMNSWVGAPLQVDLNEKAIPRKFRKTMGKSASLAALAVSNALASSPLPEELLSSGRVGVSFGSSTGSVDSTERFFAGPFETHSMHNLPSGMFFQIMSHTAAANIAQMFNIQGRVISPNAACSSSAQAIGLGFEAIRDGRQDIMLCGGSDELHVMTNVSFDVVQAASFKYNDQPQRTPRPFDRDRDGTVCGEGAGCLILESEESALRRGANVFGEVVGFATSASGENMAQADAESIVHCMQAALDDAGLNASQVDYINAHATGTLVGDISEARAVRQLFGENRVPVSSLKGLFGHTLGASAVIELIVGLQMMKNNTILPSSNLENIDPDCQGVWHVTGKLNRQIDIMMKNSFAFGGINSVLIVERYGND